MEFENDDLVPPHGVLLVAWLHDRPAGCAGLRVGQTDASEVVRVFADGNTGAAGSLEH